jgi:hypothetical protein
VAALPGDDRGTNPEGDPPMKKTNINVKRYSNCAGWEGTIEPDDRSWIVFLPSDDGPVLFYRRVSVELVDGKTEHHYYDVELPGPAAAAVRPDPLAQVKPPELPAPSAASEYAIDYTVVPGPGANEEPGFFASLSARSIACWAPTEHGAIQGLLNYAIRLAVAGALDHTGEPMRHVSKRRYHAVFGPPETQLEQVVEGEHGTPVG